MTTDEITGSVCSDCISVIANGDTSGIEDFDAWEAAVDAADATEGGRYNVVPVGEDSYFSNADCDFCRRPLAGTRVDVVFLDTRS